MKNNNFHKEKLKNKILHRMERVQRKALNMCDCEEEECIYYITLHTEEEAKVFMEILEEEKQEEKQNEKQN